MQNVQSTKDELQRVRSVLTTCIERFEKGDIGADQLRQVANAAGRVSDLIRVEVEAFAALGPDYRAVLGLDSGSTRKKASLIDIRAE